MYLSGSMMFTFISIPFFCNFFYYLCESLFCRYADIAWSRMNSILQIYRSFRSILLMKTTGDVFSMLAVFGQNIIFTLLWKCLFQKHFIVRDIILYCQKTLVFSGWNNVKKYSLKCYLQNRAGAEVKRVVDRRSILDVGFSSIRENGETHWCSTELFSFQFFSIWHISFVKNVGITRSWTCWVGYSITFSKNASLFNYDK